MPAIILIGIVLGISGGCAAAALKENSDQSIYSSDDLIFATGLQVFGVIPEIATPKDHSRQRFRIRIAVAGSLVFLVVAVALFHFFIMDLDVLWAKLDRRFSL